eukprot:TRINITY_DN2858_c0_g2_i7.p1 TRINITY_DN2858_c0_g2~~TRINITY_DN2858_c0_g2_i7.p1  ORF type:complete len:280 (-),score=79.30 TRINITY_DN2858_c0_g2_i7:122-961(-)
MKRCKPGDEGQLATKKQHRSSTDTDAMPLLAVLPAECLALVAAHTGSLRMALAVLPGVCTHLRGVCCTDGYLAQVRTHFGLCEPYAPHVTGGTEDALALVRECARMQELAAPLRKMYVGIGVRLRGAKDRAAVCGHTRTLHEATGALVPVHLQQFMHEFIRLHDCKLDVQCEVPFMLHNRATYNRIMYDYEYQEESEADYKIRKDEEAMQLLAVGSIVQPHGNYFMLFLVCNPTSPVYGKIAWVHSAGPKDTCNHTLLGMLQHIVQESTMLQHTVQEST